MIGPCYKKKRTASPSYETMNEVLTVILRTLPYMSRNFELFFVTVELQNHKNVQYDGRILSRNYEQ